MSILSRIQTGKNRLPPRIVLYGTEGIGKSTFASQAPKPVFIQTEDGLGEIDCAKFDLAMRIDAVTDALDGLLKEEHEFQTVVIDSLDWMERLIHDAVCKEENVTSIEKAGGGYAKGYTFALTPLRYILGQLNRLRDEKGMAVICIAHAKIEKVEDPEVASTYDRYTLRMHKSAIGVVCEWADAVLFAHRKKRIQTEDAGFGKKRATAIALGANGGERVMRTSEGPACVAKNRYGLPEELPLSWEKFVSSMS
jgi:hypothetical protein